MKNANKELIESLKNDELPKFTEEYDHPFKYDRYNVLASLYREICAEMHLHSAKSNRYHDVNSPIFKPIIDKFKRLFDLEDGETKIVFDSVIHKFETPGSTDPFFRFVIKKFDPEEMKLFIDAGRSKLLEVDYVPSCEDEQFFLNRHYVPKEYFCIADGNTLSFSLKEN